MSSTARSYSMLDQSRKRKYEDGNCEPAAECDSDSDSDCACIAPDPDVEDSLNTLHVVEKQGTLSTSSDTGPSIKANNVGVEKHVPFSSSCDTGLSIMQAPFIKSWDTGPSIKQNAHVVEKLVAISTSCDTGPSVKQNAHVVEEPVAISTSCDTGPSVTPVPFITSSIMQGQVCVDGTSSANMTASVPSAPRPSDSSWATKYLPLHVEPQNSPTVDLVDEKKAAKMKKAAKISTWSLMSANTVPSYQPKTVWIFGDSWIHRARKYAQVRQQDLHLGIPHMTIFWFPQEEMRWSSLISAISNVEGVPEADVVLIHCGAEDLCYLSRYDLTSAMKKDIQIIKSMFPKKQVVFSCIPQRKIWVTTAALGTSIGRARRNINKFLAEFLSEHSMFHIRHDNIIKDNKLFYDDGVQLSDLGNKHFLQNIQQALKALP